MNIFNLVEKSENDENQPQNEAEQGKAHPFDNLGAVNDAKEGKEPSPFAKIWRNRKPTTKPKNPLKRTQTQHKPLLNRLSSFIKKKSFSENPKKRKKCLITQLASELVFGQFSHFFSISAKRKITKEDMTPLPPQIRMKKIKKRTLAFIEERTAAGNLLNNLETIIFTMVRPMVRKAIILEILEQLMVLSSTVLFFNFLPEVKNLLQKKQESETREQFSAHFVQNYLFYLGGPLLAAILAFLRHILKEHSNKFINQSVSTSNQILRALIFQKLTQANITFLRTADSSLITRLTVFKSQSLVLFIGKVPDLWTFPIILMLSFALISYLVSVRAVLSFGIFLATSVFLTFLIKNLSHKNLKYEYCGSLRSSIVDEMLKKYSAVKNESMEKYFEKRVLRLRKLEIRYLRQVFNMRALSSTIMSLTPILSSLLIIVIEINYRGSELSIAETIGILSVIANLQKPLKNYVVILDRFFEYRKAMSSFNKFFFSIKNKPEDVMKMAVGVPRGGIVIENCTTEIEDEEDMQKNLNKLLGGYSFLMRRGDEGKLRRMDFEEWIDQQKEDFTLNPFSVGSRPSLDNLGDFGQKSSRRGLNEAKKAKNGGDGPRGGQNMLTIGVGEQKKMMKLDFENGSFFANLDSGAYPRSKSELRRMSRTLKNENSKKQLKSKNPKNTPKNANPSTQSHQGTSPSLKFTRQFLNVSLNFTIKPHEKIVIFSELGDFSESDFILSLLGEAMVSEGSIRVNGRLLLVDFDDIHFLVGQSIRDNILMGSSFDQSRYKQALQTSGIQLDSLPGGDMTEVLLGGHNLGFGLPKRILLARSLYMDADIYIIDGLEECQPDEQICDDLFDEIQFFDQIVKNSLKLKTVIYLSRNEQVVSRADRAFCFEDGLAFEVLRESVEAQATSSWTGGDVSIREDFVEDKSIKGTKGSPLTRNRWRNATKTVLYKTKGNSSSKQSKTIQKILSSVTSMKRAGRRMTRAKRKTVLKSTILERRRPSFLNLGLNENGRFSGDETERQLGTFIEDIARIKMRFNTINRGRRSSRRREKSVLNISDFLGKIEQSRLTERLSERMPGSMSSPQDGRQIINMLFQGFLKIKDKKEKGKVLSDWDESGVYSDMLRGIKRYIFILGAGRIGLIFLVTTLTASTMLLLDFWIAAWKSDVLELKPKGLYIAIYVLMFLGSLFAIYLRDRWIYKLLMQNSNEVHKRLLKAATEVESWWLLTHPSTQLGYKLSFDLKQIDQKLNNHLKNGTEALTLIIWGLLVVNYVYLGVYLAIFGLIFAYVQHIVKRFVKATQCFIEFIAENNALMQGMFKKTLNNSLDLRILGGTSMLEKSFANQANELQRAISHLGFFSKRWFGARMAFVYAFLTFFAYFVPVCYLYFLDDFQPRSMLEYALAFSWSLKLPSYLESMVTGYLETFLEIASFGRMENFSKNSVKEKDDHPQINSKSLFPVSVIFKNVNLTINGISILKDISFNIRAGKKVALVGESGCGKHHVLKLLTGYYNKDSRPDSVIHIFGRNIDSVNARDLKSSVCVLEAEPVIYSGTVKDNIDPDGEFSENEILWFFRFLDVVDALSNKTGRRLLTNARSIKISECSSPKIFGSDQDPTKQFFRVFKAYKQLSRDSSCDYHLKKVIDGLSYRELEEYAQSLQKEGIDVRIQKTNYKNTHNKLATAGVINTPNAPNFLTTEAAERVLVTQEVKSADKTKISVRTINKERDYDGDIVDLLYRKLLKIKFSANDNNASMKLKKIIKVVKAMIKNSKILVIEQAALNFGDGQTGSRVGKLISELDGSKTVIFLLSNYKHLKHFDEFILLEKGCLAAQGDIRDSIKRQESELSAHLKKVNEKMYKDLYSKFTGEEAVGGASGRLGGLQESSVSQGNDSDQDIQEMVQEESDLCFSSELDEFGGRTSIEDYRKELETFRGRNLEVFVKGWPKDQPPGGGSGRSGRADVPDCYLPWREWRSDGLKDFSAFNWKGVK